MKLTLKQLKYFQMVCELKSVTQAAERLYVSQPSITNAIKNLEEDLSITLFDRSKKKLILTPEGEIFLDRVNTILSLVDNTIAEMKDYKDLKRGVLTIGVPPMIGTFIFPRIFTIFKKNYPNIQLNIIENGSLAVKKMIETDELDMGLIIMDSINEHLSALPILNSELLVCLNKEHNLSNRCKLTFDDIKNEPLILLKEGFYIRREILKLFSKHNVQPNIILSSNQLQTIQSLIINDVGISFLMKEIVQKNKSIIKIPFTNKVPINVHLVWKKDRYLSKISKTFIDFIASHSIY
ncbi:LysR family transcriptional regulator [Garciella nitratireducens]|uniref:DNA-binding transcriptional regulator, LysR family n=1 Tax=Garciella nitratireducens DSM 15102 TaxID=1121911 RepID=A0A1T4KDH6_9FIRM|nr:LysR family transcriptional regulator [Garciella nitratireducens]SJZ40441.1 DNA-binding transcriptional regulator, LysR family [Garciella nitratireducens DSM 15102]